MTQGIHFEQSIIELEGIVRQLEKGELSLEDSLKQFEKGISLARQCHEVLQKAEQKVEILTSSDTESGEQSGSFLVINYYKKRQEEFLIQVINNASIPAATIRSALNYVLFSGGKRIRPMLVYLTGRLLGCSLDILDVIAASVELTHCYSLIHDDLPAMDNDDLRRGKPSCHKAFNEATAILAGDGMQALAIEVLLSHLPCLLEANKVIAITLELVKASGISGMVSGQSLDLSELEKTCSGEEQLREIHSLKTERLILACIEMVVGVHASSDVYKTALRTYASHLGLVFQIQDDYLDHYAPTKVLGKGRSSDRANHKITFANVYAKNKLEEEIIKYYRIAIDALAPFGQTAFELIELTEELRERSRLC